LNRLIIIYIINMSSYQQKGNDIDGEASNNYSGASVSMNSDGTIVAIGAYGNDNPNGSDSGHVRVYEWNGSAWVQRGGDIDGESAGDYSGYGVSISSNGNILAVGALLNDDNGSDSGHVRVFEWNTNTEQWEKKGQDIDGETSGDYFGRNVSINADGTIFAAGAYKNNGNGSDSGHVRVFEWNTDTEQWEQKGQDIDGESSGDYAGISVSINSDGTIIAMGASRDDGNGSNSGSVRVFEWNTDTEQWVQKGLNIDGEAGSDSFGVSVSINSDGTVVAAGATLNDGPGGELSNGGHARVFEWNGSAWVQRGEDFDAEAVNDRYGYSISLNSDGTIVAVGAERGGPLNGGYAKLFEWDGSSWNQIGEDLDSEDAGDNYGFSISVSSNGSAVAVGGQLNDGINGSRSGHVRIFEILSVTYVFEQELEELDESYTSEVINTIKAIELAEENQVIEDVLVPSNITNDDATIRSARHNAIGIVFTNNDTIRSFLTAPSNIKLETLIEKDDAEVINQNVDLSVNLADVPQTRGFYVNLTNSGDTITVINTDGASFVVTQTDDDGTEFTVSGETLDGEEITGTYSPGDTLSAFDRTYFFGGFGSDNTVEEPTVSNPAVELTNNNIGKTYGNAKVNKSIGYSGSTIIRNLKENTIGNYHNVSSSLSKNNIKAKSYAEYIAFLKARNRMNIN
jgi:PBP1b-binding outer membrane lipoprotein LpoB